MKHEFICSQCNEHKIHESDCSTGYAIDKNDNKICFKCCGENDARELKELVPGKPFSMYLNTKEKTLSNWPGSFKLDVPYIQKGKHNIAGNRYDTWFCFGGSQYHAVQYGENTTIAHIRKLKRNRLKTA